MKTEQTIDIHSENPLRSRLAEPRVQMPSMTEPEIKAIRVAISRMKTPDKKVDAEFAFQAKDYMAALKLTKE